MSPRLAKSLEMVDIVPAYELPSFYMVTFCRFALELASSMPSSSRVNLGARDVRDS